MILFCMYFNILVSEVECLEQLARVNKWIGGEKQALKLLVGRLKLEEGVG